MEEVVIVAALRTAVGKFGGTLAKVPAADLGAHVIRALIAKTGIKPEHISEVILGQVLTAGVGQNARCRHRATPQAASDQPSQRSRHVRFSASRSPDRWSSPDRPER